MTFAVGQPEPWTAALAQAGGAEEEASLAVMLLFALLGGLILNIMPCVLPVLSIFGISFARAPTVRLAPASTTATAAEVEPPAERR